MTPHPTYPRDPVVILLGATAAAVRNQLGLVCRFFGFHLAEISEPGEASLLSGPVLVVVTGSNLASASPANRVALVTAAESFGAPIAVVEVGPECPAGALASLTNGVKLSTRDAGSGATIIATATLPSETGYELREFPFPVGPAAIFQIEETAATEMVVLANVMTAHHGAHPAMIRLGSSRSRRYFLGHVCEPADAAPAPGAYPPTRFGAIAPFLLLLRDVGGERCWLPPCPLANLTIDDPYLTEPYGSLSYAGLLAEMRGERFHATIGFVPWNYDRNDPAVVDLVRENPEHFSVAVHGNNHDRYEFFRYEARPGDNQRGKPLPVQTFNVRQAMARLDAMEQRTGLKFDRVMVFPHGISPADTLGALKRAGYWATFNYANVPLGESPSADPALTARAVNADWHGFPAVRRAYPDKYPEAAVAIDLFLGNPVLFMAHQDNFFDGIAAFTPHARRVNARQPAVRWTSLGEISRRLHLLRWLDDCRCEVRMMSRHARLENNRTSAAQFFFTKIEPEPGLITRVAIDDVDVPWTAEDRQILFTANLPPRSASLVEIHYRAPDLDSPISLRRSGLRRRLLRMIADFRDLHLPRSTIGRLLTRRYYRGGKKRLTFGAFVTRLRCAIRGRQF